MRSVRCDACGTRALMAASKCPKCGHEIAVRDGFGEMLPLARCSTCDSYYPAKLGACRWCGTVPQRAPIAPFVWKGVGIATFFAMAWGAWAVHDDPPADASKARLAAVLKPDSSAGSLDSSMMERASASIDSIVPDSSADFDSTDVVASDSTIESVATVVAAISDSIGRRSLTSVVSADSTSLVAEPVAQSDPGGQPAIAPREPEVYRDPRVTRASPPRDTRVVSEKDVVAGPGPAAVAERRPVAATTRVTAPTVESSKPRATSKPAPRTIARSPARSSKANARTPTPPATPKASTKAVAKAPAKTPAKASGKVLAKAPPKSRAARAAWVNSVARNWVTVRAGADRGSRVIASIGPNTRVQLGETRGGWRRIRAKGLAGWVDHRSFFAGVGSSRRTGRLAAR